MKKKFKTSKLTNMAFPLRYLKDGVLTLDYVKPISDAFYEIVKGPNTGNWVHIKDTL